MKRDQLDCASVLLDYAKSNGIPVTFKCEDGDLLGLAIYKRSDVHVDFVLVKLAGKYVPFAEAIEILDSHLGDLVSRFQKLIFRYLKEEKFTIEYARFDAPKSLFGRNGKIPVGMSTEHYLEDWSMDSDAAKQLWIQHSAYTEELFDTTDEQI